MRREGLVRVEATREAEEEWRRKRKVTALSDVLLFPGTDSWYMGAQVPGKADGAVELCRGIPLCEKEIWEVLDIDFAGFAVA